MTTSEPFLEADLQRAFIDVARTLGYKCAHFRAAMTKHGWRTPVQADGKGFPDLMMFGHGRRVAVEFKHSTGMSEEQEEWRDVLLECGFEFYVVTTDMWLNDFDVVRTILYPKGGRHDRNTAESAGVSV